MDLILCHQTADFDALASAVGLSRLYPGARIVLTGGVHQGVKEFLAIYRDEFPLIELRSVNPDLIQKVIVVDTQQSDRLGKAKAWLSLPQVREIIIYDHHTGADRDIAATSIYLESVGSSTTLVAEQLEAASICLTPTEATLMALGIHSDTGSLTYPQTTVRDASSLTWLMHQQANLKTIAQYLNPPLSPELQVMLAQALAEIVTTPIQDYTIGHIVLLSPHFVPGLSSIAEQLMDLVSPQLDILLLAHYYGEGRLILIGRSRTEEINLGQLFQPYGGGGHSSAASLSVQGVSPQTLLPQLLTSLEQQIPSPITARDIMSSPVRTIRPDTTIGEAERILLRYGHSGLSVVDQNGNLVGIISRRDLDLALHHGLSHAPVKGYMTCQLKTITPDATLMEIEEIMVTYDVGRLPVLADGNLVGIVTRTDILRQWHQQKSQKNQLSPTLYQLLPLVEKCLDPFLWQFLQQAAYAAQQRGWHLYLVGGAVRDLLLAQRQETLFLADLDLVVDGFHQTATAGAGVELATELQAIYPQARLSVHGEFQTAALSWHQDPILGSLLVDIATARTEFYPYPAANPEVEASSIRQDLYRRDFTINALALRLTNSRRGELLDFFGGYLDLESRQIRVLHANSFIEDPTRIYRGVRFATRLNFTLEHQTETYIRYAIHSGIYEDLRRQNKTAPALTTRLKAELKYILTAPYGRKAIKLLDSLGALSCLHPDLIFTEALNWQLRYLDRILKYFPEQCNLTPWLLRLELILASLNSEAAAVAERLTLPLDSIGNLQQLVKDEQRIQTNLPGCQSPSEIYWFLNSYSRVRLVLILVRSEYTLRWRIWQYLQHLAQVKPLLNGDDLKRLGYPPGPKYKLILEQLLSATLNGEITTALEAQTWLARNYPR